MSRIVLRVSQILIDCGVLTIAFVMAYLLRFDWAIPSNMQDRMAFLLPFVVALQYAVLMSFGVPRFVWRYVGLREAVRILEATAVSTAVLLVARLGVGILTSSVAAARFGVVPMGVILGNMVLAFLGVAGVRILRRIVGERADSSALRAKRDVVPTILIGAGQGGVLVAKEIAARPDLGINALAFVDDDLMKVGKVIHGIPVGGIAADLAAIALTTGAKQAIITISNAPGREIRRLVELCGAADLPVKIIPGLHQLVGGTVNLSRIRDVAIEDLLRREPVKLDETAIAALVRDRVVLVTGAGGSIGSEVCRQVTRFGPSALVLVEQAENSLFHIHRELVDAAHGPQLVPVVADICDRKRMEQVFSAHGPHVVFHAAAHKHVPMMEWNPGEAIKNNVQGTRCLAELSDQHGVDRFVMISTDKAVNPTSVMGASKRAAEIFIQALSEKSRTHFATVRFGNVLGSAGSVIPIFNEQIEKGGPVTVTHPEMKRYFMTIPEACQLVMQAAALSTGGEIFILDMGEPVRIVDLAYDLIKLSGLVPHDDIEVRFTGIRPGEKLFEELSMESEGIEKTLHPKIFVGSYQTHDLTSVKGRVDRLCESIDDVAGSVIRHRLRDLVPEYTPESTVPPPAAPAAEPPAPAPAEATASRTSEAHANANLPVTAEVP